MIALEQLIVDESDVDALVESIEEEFAPDQIGPIHEKMNFGLYLIETLLCEAGEPIFDAHLL